MSKGLYHIAIYHIQLLHLLYFRIKALLLNKNCNNGDSFNADCTFRTYQTLHMYFFFIKSLHKIKIGAKIIPISQKKKLSLAKITELARGRQHSYPQNSMTWSLMGILIAWNGHSLNARCPNLIPLKLHFLPIFSLYFQ